MSNIHGISDSNRRDNNQNNRNQQPAGDAPVPDFLQGYMSAQRDFIDPRKEGFF